jgi:hypothetical protein
MDVVGAFITVGFDDVSQCWRNIDTPESCSLLFTFALDYLLSVLVVDCKIVFVEFGRAVGVA